jgi:hypothetical protein
MPTRLLVTTYTVMLAAVALVASCDGSSSPGGGSVVPPATPLTVPPQTWTWVPVPDSQCDDGSPTGFAVNPGDSKDLFIYFEGGGACWDALTCRVLKTATQGPVGATEWAARQTALAGVGPFDRTRAANPFKDATMVYIPYCTGDLHAGNNVASYAIGADVQPYHHAGRPDTVLFLSRIFATWPVPERLVVSGSSAGGYGALLNYDLFRRVYPAARAYLVDDAGPLLEADGVPPSERDAWFTTWKLGDVVDPFCPACRTDLSAAYTALTSRYRGDRMALLSSLQDVTIRTYFMLTPDAFQTALLQLIADHITPTVGFRTFVITGEQHTLLSTMTTSTTNNVVLEPWLNDMVNDKAGWVSVQP